MSKPWWRLCQVRQYPVGNRTCYFIKITVFLHVTPYSLIDRYQNFRAPCCLYLEGLLFAASGTLLSAYQSKLCLSQKIIIFPCSIMTIEIVHWITLICQPASQMRYFMLGGRVHTVWNNGRGFEKVNNFHITWQEHQFKLKKQKRLLN